MSLGTTPRPVLGAPASEDELEERLSRPTPEVIEALAQTDGDVMVLGAGGKMGPSLVTMAVRAVRGRGTGRRVIAVSRWSDRRVVDRLAAAGAEIVTADLTDRTAYATLPTASNVVFMAGQKFGTADAPYRTWMTNTIVPARVADRFAASRIVVFSTGNVYPLSPVTGHGSAEGDPLAPVGEYAASCLGRERVFEHAAIEHGTPVALMRLNYAVDLRYGVLVDLALKILSGAPVDLQMGYVNCIWQGDANAMALRLLPLASVPPYVLNVTGAERLSVRDVSLELGRLLGREPRFTGREAPDALLSDTRKAQSLFGEPLVNGHTLLAWVAEWVRAGGRTSGKATRFEQREGVF